MHPGYGIFGNFLDRIVIRLNVTFRTHGQLVLDLSTLKINMKSWELPRREVHPLQRLSDVLKESKDECSYKGAASDNNSIPYEEWMKF